MNAFGFYTILLIGFLGGFVMAWILLCRKAAQAAIRASSSALGTARSSLPYGTPHE
jgi:hypothetical protein